MTGNRGVQFTGTYAMDPALLTRSLTVEFEYAPPQAEQTIAVEASGCEPATSELFVKFATESRARALTNPDYSPISTREVIAACKLVKAGLSPDVAARVAIINQASPEGGAESVRTGLELIWNGIRTPVAQPTVAAPCGGSHPWKTDTNGNLLKCALPSTSPHSEHQSLSGDVWS